MSLPDLSAPQLRLHRGMPGSRSADALDALLFIARAEPPAMAAPALPYAQAWRALQRRVRPVALEVRSATLPNPTQTQAVLAYAKDGASPFERLLLAGRMLREIGARQPTRIGLAVDARLADAAGWYEALVAAALAHSFALPDYRRRRGGKWRLRAVELYGAPRLELARVKAGARAGNLARWLTALPPNKLDVRAYRAVLRMLARQHGLRLRWYSQAALQRLGAAAFLAVARGNAAADAGIARLTYRGRRGAAARTARPDLALIGKGILFDTGGINLKTHRHMLDMHTDMGGSAVALGTLVALAELRTPINAEAWLALSENNIGPSAYRPQEVVRALNGTTIQIIHTDAEGRMVLADTLALAARSKPRLAIDFATLTGACVAALTERYSGVFTNRPQWAAALVEAGTASGERVWHFPLDDDFDSDLESAVADIMQCSVEGKGDHILAARFLKRFVPQELPWIHVDLSSVTRRGGLGHIGTDVTGFGVRWALELLLSQRLRDR